MRKKKRPTTRRAKPTKPAEALSIDQASYEKAMNESARTRWYVNRIGGAFEAAEKAGGETFQRFGDIGRAIKVYGRWPMLFAVEDALAESFWGHDRTPPPLAEGEVAEDDGSPEWVWLNRRMNAALSALGDPNSVERRAALTMGGILIEARGQRGPWPLLFAIEELAAMMIEADGRRENGAPRVRVSREIEFRAEARA